MKKQKTHVNTIKTREELDAVLGAYASVANARGQLVLAMEERIVFVRKDYEARLAAFDAELEATFGDLEAWAAFHKDEFAAKKSIDLVHGTLGFRTGNPTLKTVKGVKWEHVLDVLKCVGLMKYVRQIEEPNKEALLADREIIGAAKLETLGLRVEQTERFFVDPKTETP